MLPLLSPHQRGESLEVWFAKQTSLTRILSLVALALGLLAFYLTFAWVNNHYSEVVPRRAGALVEGVVGVPRHINPVLASYESEQDLVALIYSGLFRQDETGVIVPDLAESYEISDDQKTYTVHINEAAVFQDQTPVTAEDVVFTIKKILDPDVRSPKRGDFTGVDLEILDEHTLRFILPRPHTPFLNSLTVGILPKHIWENESGADFFYSSYNLSPIGSGPYQVKGIEYNNTAPKAHLLVPSSTYLHGYPYIASLKFVYFSGENERLGALKRGTISAAAGISGSNAAEFAKKTGRYQLISWELDRTYAVFFNQNHLPERRLRRALSALINRQALVDEALGGYGEPITYLPDVADGEDALAESTPEELFTAEGYEKNSESGFWEKDGKPLAFVLEAPEVSELSEVARLVVEDWREFGIDATLNLRPLDELTAEVLRPREYTAILFGFGASIATDPYPFFHSSERADPGLNFALYTNTLVDDKVEELRETSTDSERQALLKVIGDELSSDAPVAFLFAPEALYVVPPRLSAVEIGSKVELAHRFATVTNWYLSTERIWTFLKH